MIMKNQLLNLKMIALMCLMMVLGGVNVWAQESFNKTYSYGLSDWKLTNYENKDTYYLVPNTGSESVATIHGIFTGKVINSDVVITINCATFGNGDNPTASTFSVFNSSNCATAVKTTQSGKLPTSGSKYTDVVYTVKLENVSLLTNDLAIKIKKTGRQIRLKSINVKFSFELNANSYSVAWNVNGKAYTEGTPTTKVFEGKKVTTLPTIPKDINGKVFVGWTNKSLSATQDVAPSVLFKDAADAPKVTGDVTYYAVFANKTGDGEVKYTKLTSNKFKTDATYVIGAEGKEKGSIDYFYKYAEVNTNGWGQMTSDLSVNSPVVFVLSGTANKLVAKDNKGNYLKCVNKNFQMSSSEASIKLNTDGTLLDVNGKSYRLRYNTLYGLRWYGINTTTGNLAYFYEVSGGYTYSGYCTTVGTVAEPTYTAQTLTFKAHVDADYYATFSNDKVVFMPENVTPKTVVVQSGEIMFMTSQDDVFGDFAVADIDGSEVIGYYIPANTGVLLESKDKTVTYYTVDNIGNTGYVDGLNMLQPAPTNGGLFTAEDGYKYYKLAYNDYYAKTGLGFYWGADNGGAFKVKAGTAYLAVPKANDAGAKGFAFNGEATGIEGVNANVENAKAIYNLNGQRVASMAKPGLYIVNGKKVVRK